MINIRQKTQAEIEQEKADYIFAAAVAKGIPKEVCKTYLTKKDGTRVDTRNLTEDQILGLIHNDLIDFSSAQGSYKTTGKTELDSFDLIIALKENGYTPSVNVVSQLFQMYQQFGHIVMDIIGSFDTSRHFDKATTIAYFQKASSGDYSAPQTDELAAVLEQMAINEKNRNNLKRR